MADDPLRAAMEKRRDEIKAKLAARKNKPGFEQNVEHMQTVLGEMERLLAAPPEGEE